MPRKHPRLSLTAQVVNLSSGETGSGEVLDISVGGLLVLARGGFQRETEVMVRFKLPNGQLIEALGVVRHSNPAGQVGIKFVLIEEAQQKEVADYVEEVRPYFRRGVRLARRLSVVLRWSDLEGNPHEDVAETVQISAFGGKLLCKHRFKAGEEAYLWWPEQQKGAPIRIVFRQLGGAGDLAEVGFEFQGVDKFWGIEFAPHRPLWEL